MPPQITAFFQRFGAGLKSFTAGQRTLAVLGAALLVVGIVALSAWLTRPALTPLFSGLQEHRRQRDRRSAPKGQRCRTS